MPTSSETVATVSGAQDEPRCDFCGGPVPPQKRHAGEEKRYCSDLHRSRAYERDHPRISVSNSDKKSRSQKVLARLKQGPATALELIQAGGGTAATSRVRELRSRGYVIRCGIKTGEHPRYILISEPGENE